MSNAALPAICTIPSGSKVTCAPSADTALATRIRHDDDDVDAQRRIIEKQIEAHIRDNPGQAEGLMRLASTIETVALETPARLASARCDNPSLTRRLRRRAPMSSSGAASFMCSVYGTLLTPATN